MRTRRQPLWSTAPDYPMPLPYRPGEPRRGGALIQRMRQAVRRRRRPGATYPVTAAIRIRDGRRFIVADAAHLTALRASSDYQFVTIRMGRRP